MGSTEQHTSTPVGVRTAAGRCIAALTTFLFASTLTGCFVIGASSRGGFFIWPGGLGLLVIIVILALLLRRR